MSNLTIIVTTDSFDSSSSRRRREVQWYTVYDGATELESYTQRRFAERHKAGKPVLLPFRKWDNGLHHSVKHWRVWYLTEKREFTDEISARTYMKDLERPMFMEAVAA